MCGIAFLFAPTCPTLGREVRMAGALASLQHRGPDAGQQVQGPGFTAGHRRLSIIDLAGSPQPMQDPSGRWTLVFNGELYNYHELRAGLQSSWTFRHQGDTEVLLAGLICHGPDFLENAEGMWAFALWDRETQSVLLARDRLGKKPLYFQHQPDWFACASELPALRHLTPGPWTEDEDSSADFFRYGLQLPGSTAYREVREVLPGHILTWGPACGIKTYPYWRISPQRHFTRKNEAEAKLRECLRSAVRKRLVADVEVGAFLSGGIDSSLIVGLMAEGGRSPKTFTIGFDDPSYDERKFARLVANTFGTSHREEVLQEFSRSQLEELILKHVGQPFTDSSLLPTSLVSQIAARDVKVALSGDGGDELFSGYQRYQARAILRWYTRLPQTLRRSLHQTIRWSREPTHHHSRSIIKKAHLFVSVAERLDEETPYVAPIMFTARERQALCPDLASLGHEVPGLPEETEPDDIATMMMADALIYMPQDILVKVDRASMAHGLEVRAPFLDHHLVELAFSLPRVWHRRGFSGKRMLRSAFSSLLPRELWQRRKQGFGVPIHAWFRQSLGSELLRLAYETPNHPLRPSVIEKMLQQHCQGGRDYGYRLWAIYVYLLWRANEKTASQKAACTSDCSFPI